MIIDGEFTVNAPIESVWNFLIDFEQVSQCMPGVGKVEPTEDNTYSGVVTVKVGPISVSFNGTVVKILEQAPSTLRAKLQGQDRNTASMVTGEFTSQLAALEASSTRVSYRFDMAIRGRLGQFGQAVILDTSKQLTAEFVKCVKTRLEQPESSPPITPPKPDVASIASRSIFKNLGSGLADLWEKLRGQSGDG